MGEPYVSKPVIIIKPLRHITGSMRRHAVLHQIIVQSYDGAPQGPPLSHSQFIRVYLDYGCHFLIRLIEK